MKSTPLLLKEIIFRQDSFLLELSIAFPPGKLTVVLGPSGSGKTTILNLLAGFLKPEKGEIIQGGRNVITIPPQLRKVGMVFQELALFPHLSLLQNVAYGLRSRGKDRREAEERAQEMLLLVGLQKFARRRPHSLSGGERQRVALARALATDPELLLLDEPLSSLDTALRRYLGQEVRRIQKLTGITTLLVTHDQEEALALADHLIIIKEGKLLQSGSPHEVWESPVDPFVAVFLGRSSLLPVLDYRRQKEGHVTVRTLAGELTFPPETPLPDGSSVVLIRPEGLRPANPRKQGPDILSGSVAASVYAGGGWRLSLLGGGLSVGGRIEADSTETASLGTLMKWQVKPEAARLVPGEFRPTSPGQGMGEDA